MTFNKPILRYTGFLSVAHARQLEVTQGFGIRPLSSHVPILFPALQEASTTSSVVAPPQLETLCNLDADGLNSPWFSIIVWAMMG